MKILDASSVAHQLRYSNSFTKLEQHFRLSDRPNVEEVGDPQELSPVLPTVCAMRESANELLFRHSVLKKTLEALYLYFDGRVCSPGIDRRNGRTGGLNNSPPHSHAAVSEYSKFQ